MTFGLILLTEGDETRVVSVNLFEELGHVQIGHTQSGAQQRGKLLPGDSLILIRIKQLHEKGTEVQGKMSRAVQFFRVI